MASITVQCRLVANEDTRRVLWHLMAGLNTPLIGELLSQVNQHPDFLTWRQKGKIPSSIIKQLCQPLRADSRFAGQPGRFYSSAITCVDGIYKSWLQIQNRLQQKLQGQQRWLEMLKSDAELAEMANCDLATLRQRAGEILDSADWGKPETATKSRKDGLQKNKQARSVGPTPNFSKVLFAAYDETDDPGTQAAIAYLLKNGCKLPDKQEEEPKEFARRYRTAEIRVQRLTEQLESRIPRGRDLTDAQWLETLSIATSHAPQGEAEARSWQDFLLRESSQLPIPVLYGSGTDLLWIRNQKGRICVRFSGFGDHTFQVYCDRRQLHWFERFLEDQQILKDGKNQHSSSLFTLRAARIAWQEGHGRGNPWQVHHLVLQCSLDTRLWTQEGTEQVRQEKAADIAKVLTAVEEKRDLSDSQQAFVRRKNSSLARINNPFPRPSKPLYQGQPNILVGCSLGLDKPVTAAVIDASTGKVLAYRSIRQLLGDNFRLLNRQRQQQHKNAHQRQMAQRKGKQRLNSESAELGQYLDRLLADAIVSLAKAYRAGSIVVPALGGIRERVQSEIQAKAEQVCPEFIEGQRKYAKKYRSRVHRWSHNRLIDTIKSQAIQAGIAVEEGRQPLKGTPQAVARDLAISTYQSRISYND